MLSSYIICLHCSPAAQHKHNHHHLTPSLDTDFPTTSGVYKRLGQFDYGQPNCTTDHIKTCIHGEYNNWIYIGEVKEGTDDTPHGIGIKVWSNGDTQQLNNKDS